MCFIPMNVHNELFNGVRQAQVATPFACSLNIFYIYQAFILLFKALHPPSLFLSLSVPLSLFSFYGTQSRFPN